VFSAEMKVLLHQMLFCLWRERERWEYLKLNI